MQLPPNLAIEVHNKEELFKAVLICGSYKLYWYKIEQIFPSKESIFTDKKYLCFSALFLEECNKEIGYRLVLKRNLNNKQLISLEDFISQYG